MGYKAPAHNSTALGRRKNYYLTTTVVSSPFSRKYPGVQGIAILWWQQFLILFAESVSIRRAIHNTVPAADATFPIHHGHTILHFYGL